MLKKTSPNTAGLNPCIPFDECQWLRVLFLISDTERWLREQQVDHFYQLPVKGHKKLLRKNWYLGATVLAHILERHYFKISRHPSAGKFTIGVVGLVTYIRDCFQQDASPLPQSNNLQRVLHTTTPIGYNDRGQEVSELTVISDVSGRIITAFPGRINHTLKNTSYE